jgi:hypothetical protein
VTTTTAKTLTAIKSTNWKAFIATTLQKFSENILDMVITIAACSMCLAYLLITQPIAAVEYGGFVIGIFLMFLLRRIVQDFDEAWTSDEIGDRVASLENKLSDIARMIRDDIITDEEISARLESLETK